MTHLIFCTQLIIFSILVQLFFHCLNEFTNKHNYLMHHIFYLEHHYLTHLIFYFVHLIKVIYTLLTTTPFFTWFTS